MTFYLPYPGKYGIITVGGFMVYLLHCTVAFMITNADGKMEKRVYHPAIGITRSLNTQYLHVDFSRWAKNNNLELPWETSSINNNGCLVIRAYSSESAIPKEQF